jgi:hypothetical protein
MYQIRAPNNKRPKMTRNKVITGRPSAWTERSAVGVRIGASHSKAMVSVLGCPVAFEADNRSWEQMRITERAVVGTSCD